MPSLLNPNRPSLFCPGCSHEKGLKSLDKAFIDMGLDLNEVVIVTDIGCSGLFDTYFTTHAMHGLHGRALTYATGIKLSRPDLKVVVIMGDGGLGIGGAHLLAACRRNLDLTLIVLNNFNFGMTGGQYSSTTPRSANVSSSFLNTIEKPMDVCSIAESAGAPFLIRASAHQNNISTLLDEAIRFDGFSLVDLWGLCPGRYGRQNPLSLKDLEAGIARLPIFEGPVKSNVRREYGAAYREAAKKLAPYGDLREIETIYKPTVDKQRRILFLGSAGESVISSGTLLAHAAVSAGMHVAQKSEYNVTVMRGPSVTELIISPEPITYAGIEQPDIIIALSQEGVTKHQAIFHKIGKNGYIILAKGVNIPDTRGYIREVDFQGHGIKRKDFALASLSILAEKEDPISHEMLETAVKNKYEGKKAKETLSFLNNMPSP